MKRRVVMTVIGVLLCGVSCGVMKVAAMGIDPFSTVVTGLDAYLPIQYGTLYVLINAVLLVFSFVFDRHYIGLGTFINLFCLGYVTQFTYDGLMALFPDGSLQIRFVLLLLGIFLACFSGSLYMSADLGVSTYDAIALVMHHKWKWGAFKYMRIATDICCIIIGSSFYLLAGKSITMLFGLVNFATVILACFMGPLIEVFNQKISIPLLKGKK